MISSVFSLSEISTDLKNIFSLLRTLLHFLFYIHIHQNAHNVQHNINVIYNRTAFFFRDSRFLSLFLCFRSAKARLV